MHRFGAFYGLLSLLLTTPCIHGAQDSNAPALLGVDLGFSYITTAYFTASGPVTVSRFEAPQIFRTMMQATVNGTADQLCDASSDDDPLTSEINSIFQQALREVKQQKGEPMKIGSIFIAKHLYEYRNRPCWLKIFTAFKTMSSWPMPVLSVRSDIASVFTFPPDYCYDQYGRPLSQAGEDEFLVMLLDLRNSVFKMSLIEISNPGPIVYFWHTYNTSVSSWTAINGEEIEEAATKMFENQKVANVRSVLFSADSLVTEADQAAIAGLINSLERAGPGLSARVQKLANGIHFRNAIGAACAARQAALYPDNDDCDDCDASETAPKDEL